MLTVTPPAANAEAPCRPSALPGVQSAWARLQAATRSPGGLRRLAEIDGPARDAVTAGARDEFLQVAAGVLGLDPSADAARLETIEPALATGTRLMVSCDAGVMARDRAARRLVAAGYSAREIADVLGGRVTRAELDTAYRMLMAGHGARRAQAYLDTAIAARQASLEQRLAAARARHPANGRMVALPAQWEAALDRHATAHGIDPGLVQAVVAAESGGAASALSPAGAIGLMQLMPSTARMLGVNPHDPIDNLKGGIAYLAGLVRAYGDLRLALIAYNAGPGHADRVARGEITPYGETRRYLDAIGRRYPLDR